MVDYGMMATDMMYFAVARDGTTAARRSRRRTTRSSTTASRWCGREAFPLSGETGINDIRDMIASGRCRRRPRDAAAVARRTCSTTTSST